MDKRTLDTFDQSLARCTAADGFLDLFYEKFLASSPKVREKFNGTDFVRQKRALQASLHLLLLAAHDGAPDQHLESLAQRHGKAQLGIGSELYDLWLDSLLVTVAECDPKYEPQVEMAWEKVMGLGIRFMLDHYNDPPSQEAGAA